MDIKSSQLGGNGIAGIEHSQNANIRESITNPGSRASQTTQTTPQTLAQQEALFAVIREAARRAGVKTGAQGYSEKDVFAVNDQIRKDADLAQAIALARSNYRRGKGELDDDNAAALDEGSGTARGGSEKIGSVKRQEDVGGPGAAKGDVQSSSIGRMSHRDRAAFSSFLPIEEGDLVVNMLKMIDLDGDGIISVRQFLEYFVRHANEQNRFNDIEFANLVKILSESINVDSLDQNKLLNARDNLLNNDIEALEAAIYNLGIKDGMAA
ncbi:MAG: hypothetical protein HC850_03710 [Rhodomicrobium sp.]|nr:hypothetical protein [Rhodomicrobium sp.]